ncbi:oligopeptidase A [Candidiatus Paracoxiella cheracis]|uniref:oligopeptidase A n=1 Tax=Candidiatus Paracoxiella cheracis TaxID=3405120 RepID=UPI003BF6060E
MTVTAETQMPLPLFSTINPVEIEPRLDHILQANRQHVQQILQQGDHFTWENLMQPLEDLEDELNEFWEPIAHLNAVVNSPELRDAYNASLPKITEYYTELSHNQELYEAISSIGHELEYQRLNSAQRKVIDNELRDFKLSGIALPAAKKQRFAELCKQLSQLCSKFEENVLDATQGWTKHITDEKKLAGLPEHAIAAAKQTAEQRQKEGWLFTLEIPSYFAVVTYAESRAFREEMYRAYTTRASDQGPTAKQWDNTEIMQDILKYRLELARLLDFNNFAEYSLATKMVKQPQQALDFLYQLVEASLPKAREEFTELSEFAAKELGIANLEAHDVIFASEKLRQHRYAISQEELRPYFPEPQVLEGLFAIVKRLFNVRIEERKDADVWHPDVRCFALYDAKNELRSYFYFDLYARENKRGGAWMDDARPRRRLGNGELQLPIACVTCNFNPPVGSDPALFSHIDVVTLLHEFGHALQHMLTKIDYADVSGISGVPWDAVEVASQFLENWAWEKESLDLLAKHYKTGEPLPDELYQKMRKAQNFQAAILMMRQLQFALFDMRLHLEFDSRQEKQMQSILDEVRAQLQVIPVPAYNRFQHSFSHIFAGGYAAGYYSYKWAEVMASDAFSLFEEKGIFDQQTAQYFLTYILEPGGSEEPAKLFKAFRGREPKVDALLKHCGIKD